jgi:uncharacterized protein YegP (UPF0339 family)
MQPLAATLAGRSRKGIVSRSEFPMFFTITTASGGYRARAYGNNGEQMMISEVYTTKQSAKHAIEVIKTQAASANVHDQT